MTAPLKLNAGDLERLSAFLGDLSKATRVHDCHVTGHGRAQVQVTPAVILAVSWDPGTEQYVVDDRSGD